MRKASPFTFYLLYDAALTTFMPYLVLYYQQVGFTGPQIGLLTGMAPLISLVGAPLLKGGARILIARRRWLFFLTLAFVSGVGFASINTYLFPYMQELGATKTMMGLSLTISTLSEVPVLFFANCLLQRFKSYDLLLLESFGGRVMYLSIGAFLLASSSLIVWFDRWTDMMAGG